MKEFRKAVKEHKEIISFFVFVLISVSVLSITLVLVETNQDVRSRAASGTCTLDGQLIIDLEEQKFIEILNNHRATLGAGPLRLSEKLSKAAQWQGEDMIQNNYFSHTDSLGRSPQQRFPACGAIVASGSENIANANSAQAAFNAWQASTQGHKENMEDKSWTQTGIARVASGGKVRWVQTFSIGNDGTSPELEGSTNPTITTVPPPSNPTQGQTNPTITTQPTSTPPANSKEISFTFELVGIGSNTSVGENGNPMRPTRNLTLVSDSVEILAITSATYNPTTTLYEGKIFMTNEELQGQSKAFKLILKSFKEHSFQTSSIQNDRIPQFTFIAGDIDSSNSIDLNDYIDMVACIKNIRCTPDKESLNLNDDDEVDIIDLNILMRSIGQ